MKLILFLIVASFITFGCADQKNEIKPVVTKPLVEQKVPPPKALIKNKKVRRQSVKPKKKASKVHFKKPKHPTVKDFIQTCIRANKSLKIAVMFPELVGEKVPKSFRIQLHQALTEYDVMSSDQIKEILRQQGYTLPGLFKDEIQLLDMNSDVDVIVIASMIGQEVHLQSLWLTETDVCSKQVLLKGKKVRKIDLYEKQAKQLLLQEPMAYVKSVQTISVIHKMRQASPYLFSILTADESSPEVLQFRKSNPDCIIRMDGLRKRLASLLQVLPAYGKYIR